MKESISINITDLDDMKQVFEALNNLFDILLKYYAQKEDLNQFYKLVMTISVYFGTILQSLGLDDKLDDLDEPEGVLDE